MHGDDDRVLLEFFCDAAFVWEEHLVYFNAESLLIPYEGAGVRLNL